MVPLRVLKPKMTTARVVSVRLIYVIRHICIPFSIKFVVVVVKICKAWVRSQLRWAWNWLKLNVTSSNVLRIIIHWLSARRDVWLTQGSLIPEEHSLYRALKHSIRQHKLDLNLSKTKQQSRFKPRASLNNNSFFLE